MKLADLINRSSILDMKSLRSVVAISLMITTISAQLSYFDRVDPLVWTKVGIPVQIGAMFLDINYAPISPCDFIRAKKYNSNLDIQNIGLESLLHECKQIYEEKLEPALNEFRNCLMDREKGQLTRVKKEVLTIMAIGAGAILLTGWLGQAIYSYVSSESSYNRLNKMEEREREKDILLETLKARVLGNEYAIENTAKTIGEIDVKIEEVKDAVKQLARLAPSISVSTYGLLEDINREVNMLRRMTRACKRHLVSTEDYAELFHFEDLREIKDAETKLEEIRETKEKNIVISMHYPLYSNDTSVYDVR